MFSSISGLNRGQTRSNALAANCRLKCTASSPTSSMTTRSQREDSMRRSAAVKSLVPSGTNVSTATAAPSAAGVAADRLRRTTRPHVVVTDDGPGPRAQFQAQPAQRGQHLPVGGLAGEKDPWPMLAALVQGRVHVRHPPGDARRDLVAHGGDVPPGDGVDRALGEQPVDLVGDLRRAAGRRRRRRTAARGRGPRPPRSPPRQPAERTARRTGRKPLPGPAGARPARRRRPPGRLVGRRARTDRVDTARSCYSGKLFLCLGIRR